MVKNVARAWTYETCTLGIEESIDRNFPWNQHFERFQRRYPLQAEWYDGLNAKSERGRRVSRKSQGDSTLALL